MILLGEMCIKTGILLATIGLVSSVGDNNQNQTTLLGYQGTKVNQSLTKASQEFTAPPVKLARRENKSEEKSENSSETDLKTSTTQKYENSKFLFSYVVPTNSEKPSNSVESHARGKEDVKEEANDNKEDIEEEEEEEGDQPHLEEEEDEEQSHFEEDEEEVEEDKPIHQNLAKEEVEDEFEEDEHESENLAGGDEEEYDKDDGDKQQYRNWEDLHNKPYDDDSDNYEKEVEEEEEEEENNTNRGGKQPLLNSWRFSQPAMNRVNQPPLESTTPQPFEDPRPVSYASVVYDPDGKPKSELSGSFYKKPLKKTPYSGVFRKMQEHVSEDTKTVSVTTQPDINERSIQAPLEDEELDEDEKEYMEPEAVTSNIKYTIEEDKKFVRKSSRLKPIIPWRKLVWLDDDREPKNQYSVNRKHQGKAAKKQKTFSNQQTSTTAIPEQEAEWPREGLARGGQNSRMKDQIEGSVRLQMQSQTTESSEDSNEELERELMERTRQQLHAMNRENYHAGTLEPDTRQSLESVKDEDSGRSVRNGKGQNSNRVVEQYEQPARPQVQRPNLKSQQTEQKQLNISEKPNSKTREIYYQQTAKPEMQNYDEQFSEEPTPEMYYQKSTETYYELTARPEMLRHDKEWSSEESGTARHHQEPNQRGRMHFYEEVHKERDEEEKHSSEAQDLMKEKENDEDEEWKDESFQKNIVRYEKQEEVTEGSNEMEEQPTKKDRNQLYEYVVDDGMFRQSVSENKQVTTTPRKEDAVMRKEPSTVKPEVVTVKTTEKPNITQPREAKPQRYAFGTITKPKSDQFLTFKNTDDDITYNQIVSNIQSLFTTTTQKPRSHYEQNFLPSHGNCQRQMLPNYDSVNYETFIQPSTSHIHPEEESDGNDDDDDEEEDDSMPKRLPVKTYLIQKMRPPPKRIVKKPSGVKVTIYPKPLKPSYREASPASFRNAVYLTPVPSGNRVIRKVIYYKPNDSSVRYSPTNQIIKIIRPPRIDHIGVPSSHRMIIIKKF